MSLLKKWQRRKLKKQQQGKTVEKTGGAKVGNNRG